MQAGRKQPPWHRYPFGFVIYRCSYGSDAQWARFMDLMTTSAQLALDKDPHGPKIRDKFSWKVEDNKEELEGATKDEVRRRFGVWGRSVDGCTGETMYSCCIYADDEVISSVLDGGDEGPETYHPDLVLPETAFVKLLNLEFDDQPQVWTDGEISDEEERNAVNAASAADEGYEPIEGCSRNDVGWMKYEARMLIPRAYTLLMDDGWRSTYARPPRIQSI